MLHMPASPWQLPGRSSGCGVAREKAGHCLYTATSHQQQECKTYFYFSPSLPSISGGMAQATTRGVMMLPHLGFRFQAVASFQSRGKWLSFNYCLDIIVTDECLPRDILCTRVWQPALHCPVQQFREAECGSAEADLSAAPPTHHPAPDT